MKNVQIYKKVQYMNTKRGKININEEKSKFLLIDFNENPNVGVFCRSNDKFAFIQKGLTKKVKNKVSSVLDVKLVEISIAESTIVGSLLNINSSGAVVCDFIDKQSEKVISDLGFSLSVISDKFNAAGNDILVNDYGCLVHPDVKDKTVKTIKETFDVPTFKGTIAGLNTVGMAACVTNKGLLCHPKVTDSEKKLLKKIFDVPVMIGTVNHGSPIIGAGIIVNNKGAVIGNDTTGIEMGRIEESLGFI